MDNKIFISYSRKDAEEVMGIVKQIEDALRIHCWIDTKGIETAEDFEERIVKAIDDSAIVLFMLSQDSLKSKYTKKEVMYAQDEGKKVVPVCLGDAELKGWSKFKFVDIDYVRASDSLQIQKLIRDIAKWLGIEIEEKAEEKTEEKAEEVTQAIPTFNIKIRSTVNCTVYIDDEEAGHALANKILKINLPAGEYLVRCVDNNNREFEEEIELTHDRIFKPTFSDDTIEEYKVSTLAESSTAVQEPSSKPVLKQLEDVITINLGEIKFKMIRVEGGSMVIGPTTIQFEDSDTFRTPIKKVNVSTFYICQFPVTQNVWENVMKYNNSYLQEEKALQNTSFWDSIFTLLEFEDEDFKKRVKGHYPVENISLNECEEFVMNLTERTGIKFSLPTEDEWEYAARGGNKSPNFKYAGSNELSDVAWYRRNTSNLRPVGKKLPNELELYDMCGNVWEWTDSTTGNSGLHLCCGGSFKSNQKECDPSTRLALFKLEQRKFVGLRVIIRETDLI